MDKLLCSERPIWTFPQQVFVVSDLHLGGRGPYFQNGRPVPDFRMCGVVGQRKLTNFIREIVQKAHRKELPAHLVINGDFIDFLAEEESPGDGNFAAFTENEETAQKKLVRILEQPSESTEEEPIRDGNHGCKEFFDALANFVQTPGTYLTILLGNHDLELSWPEVRKGLANRLGAAHGSVYISTDGLPLIVGDLYIDHGNRSDTWNRVNYRSLARLTSKAASCRFDPPLGSELVVKYMNKIKARYSFVDLLKPETDAAIPLCWFLSPPELRRQLRDEHSLSEFILKYLWNTFIAPAAANMGAPGNSVRRPYKLKNRPPGCEHAMLVARSREDEESHNEQDWVAFEFALANAIKRSESLESWFHTVAPTNSEDTSNMGWFAHGRAAASMLGIGSSLPQMSTQEIKHRRIELWRVLRLLFDDEPERLSIYSRKNPLAESADSLLKSKRYRVVIYGHSHIINRLDRADGTYFNLGTFADLIVIPPTVLSPIQSVETEKALEKFLEDLDSNNLEQHRKSIPAFAHIVLDYEQKVQSKSLTVIADTKAKCRIEIPHQNHPDAAKFPTIWDLVRSIDEAKHR